MFIFLLRESFVDKVERFDFKPKRTLIASLYRTATKQFVTNNFVAKNIGNSDGLPNPKVLHRIARELHISTREKQRIRKFSFVMKL